MSVTLPNIDCSRLGRLAKEGGWILVGQVATVLGSLVLVRVLTGHLDPAQYGQLALGLTVAGLVNQVVMGSVANGIGRYYAIADEKKDLPAYLYSSRLLMFYATLAVLIIGIVLLGGLQLMGYSQWMGLAAAALMFAVVSGYDGTLSGIQNAARQRSVVAFHSGINAWLKILCALGVMFFLGESSTAVVIGYALSTLLVTGSQFFFLRRLIPFHCRPEKKKSEWLHKIWAFSWPFSTWGLFTWAQLSSDRWSLQSFVSTQDVGLYTVLFQLGYVPTTMASGMVVLFLGPILYQRSGDATDLSRNTNVHRITWRITCIALLLTLIAFLSTWGLHAWLFQMLVASKYRSISYLLPWVVLAGGLFAAGQILAVKLASEMRSASMIPVKIVTAVLGVILNIYGAYRAGIKGVVAAAVGFSILYFFWLAQMTWRVTTISKK